MRTTHLEFIFAIASAITTSTLHQLNTIQNCDKVIPDHIGAQTSQLDLIEVQVESEEKEQQQNPIDPRATDPRHQTEAKPTEIATVDCKHWNWFGRDFARTLVVGRGLPTASCTQNDWFWIRAGNFTGEDTDTIMHPRTRGFMGTGSLENDALHASEPKDRNHQGPDGVTQVAAEKGWNLQALEAEGTSQ